MGCEDEFQEKKKLKLDIKRQKYKGKLTKFKY